MRHRCHIRLPCLRNMHTSWEHLHRQRRRLYHGLHFNRKWKDPFHRKRRFAPFSFLGLHYLILANLEQIREYWSAYKPNVSLEMFQTPSGSIIIPGLAGMTLYVRYLHEVILLIPLRCPWPHSRMGHQGTAPSRKFHFD